MDKRGGPIVLSKSMKLLLLFRRLSEYAFIISFAVSGFLALSPVTANATLTGLTETIRNIAIIMILVCYAASIFLIPCPNCGERTISFSNSVVRLHYKMGKTHSYPVCPKCGYEVTSIRDKDETEEETE